MKEEQLNPTPKKSDISLFHGFVAHENEAEVERMIETFPDIVNQQYQTSQGYGTPLELAIDKNYPNPNIVKLLIKKGAEITDEAYRKAVRHPNISGLLPKKDITPDKMNIFDFKIAVKNDNIAEVERMIDLLPSIVNSKTKISLDNKTLLQTPLELAIDQHYPNPNIVKLLIEKSAKITNKAYRQAVLHPEIIDLLPKKKITPDKMNIFDFKIAVKNGNIAEVERLMDIFPGIANSIDYRNIPDEMRQSILTIQQSDLHSPGHTITYPDLFNSKALAVYNADQPSTTQLPTINAVDQIALAAVAGTALYKGFKGVKYLYDAFQDYTGKEASQTSINTAINISDKILAKFDNAKQSELRELSGIVKSKSKQLKAYSQGIQESSASKALSKELDEHTSLQENIDSLLGRVEALKKLKGTLNTGRKQKAINAFIKECSKFNKDLKRIEDSLETLGIRETFKKINGPGTHPRGNTNYNVTR
jgi:hypothetical protein